MRQGGSNQLFQYWNRLRGNRAAPLRTEIEPSDIRTLLADTFILEKDGRGEATFRLAGTRICSHYGQELKSRAFCPLWSAQDQARMARLVDHVFEQDAVVVLEFDGLTEQGRSVTFEAIILPLSGGQEGPRALGALFPLQKPFWLGADPVLENQLHSFRLIDPDREPLFLGNRPEISVPPLSPHSMAADLPETNRPLKKVRHLVVFEGGKVD
ncbi:PAS domain-containing protein [Nitratireductor basaltis]|uniref:PAS domain-containing protein n=1 Tax=Nitratireductor basaltis TaxID=472175 RepID=A0A084UAR1_9HYPH|nr:PAS domain-containing protein [Nitratireductor basaltis]KFB10047.1 hypothetical protein EL18_01075 [Nitratireductor basaltis]